MCTLWEAWFKGGGSHNIPGEYFVMTKVNSRSHIVLYVPWARKFPCAVEVLRGRSLSHGNMLKTFRKMKDSSWISVASTDTHLGKVTVSETGNGYSDFFKNSGNDKPN